jgi:hypothetical protein
MIVSVRLIWTCILLAVFTFSVYFGYLAPNVLIFLLRPFLSFLFYNFSGATLNLSPLQYLLHISTLAGYTHGYPRVIRKTQ